MFEKIFGPGITLFSGTFYLILKENYALLCHFILHCGVQESTPTVKTRTFDDAEHTGVVLTFAADVFFVSRARGQCHRCTAA